jgi:hypothetical protein
MAPSQEQQDLLQEIALALQDDGPVSVGTMFRSPALRTGKKVVAFLGSGPGDTLILKLPRARAAALMEEGSAEPVTIGKRTMREWIEVPARSDSAATRTAWTGFAREALLYVRSIPA